MKILGINGSPKGEKSQTRRLVLGVLEGARQTGADITFVDCCDLEIKYCKACGTCYAKGECIHDDDMPALYEKMLDADGIVLGSPVYINSVTAQLKTVLDRMADSVHCQHFTGKYGCAVSTAGGSMADETAEYMNSVLGMLGATTVGSVGVILGRDPGAIVPAEKRAKELGRKLTNAIQMKYKDPVQEKFLSERKEYMKFLVLANKDVWTHEHEHWKTMGWL
jgi:multimeric flavodoxin WrbA